MNPQGFHAKPSDPTVIRRRIILIAVVASAVLVVLGLLLPFAVREMASSRIDRAAASLKGSVTHGDIQIISSRALLIPTITFSDAGGLEIRADGVRIEVDPLAMLIGGRRITRVDVEELVVTAGTTETPLDLAGIAQKLASRTGSREPQGTPGTATKPAPRKRKGTPLPDLSVKRITGSIVSSMFSGTLEDGHASMAADPDSMDAFARKAELRLVLRPAGSETAFTVQADADMDAPGRVSRASATVSPSFTRNVRGVEIGIGGIEWKPGEISLTSPVASVPGSTRFPAGVRAEEVRVRWAVLREGDKPASSLIPDSMLKYVPESLKLLAGTVTVSEIRVKRPVVEILASADIAGPVPGAAAPVTPESVKTRVVNLFSGLAGSVESIRTRLVDLAQAYDGTRLGVTGATVTYVADANQAARAAQSFSNLDIQVDRGARGGLSARMRFECPESPSTLNEFDVDVLPDGVVEMNLKAKNLKLAPYQVVLPGWLETDARSALTDTAVKITITQGPRLEISGKIGVSDVTVHMAEVAVEPMTSMDLALSGDTIVDGPAGSLTMKDSLFSLGDINLPFSFTGTSMNDSPMLSLTGRIERVAGESLLTSIPHEAIPVLNGAKLTGTFAATIKLDVDTADLSRLVFDFAPDMADLITIDLGPAVNLELLRSTFLHRIEDRDHVVTRTIGVGSPGWVPFETVPEYFVRALTISEDARFFQHQGFSRAGIQRSLKVNLERGGFFQGASTLSQQLVKNLFLSREKTLSRKLQEAFITWQVERNLPKEKILELYLNVIEWGPEVWGLKEAANHYFAKDPSQLSVLESAFLVLIIPNPAKYHEFLEQGRVPPWFMTKVRKLVETLRSIGAISDLQALGTIQQTVRFPVDDNPENAVPDSEFAD